MPFTVIDFLLVLLVLVSMLNGWRRGFIHGLLDLLGWTLSLLAALRFYSSLARWLDTYVRWWAQVWNRPIAFILIALAAGVAVQLLGHTILVRLPKDIRKQRVNQILGIVPGLANGLILAGIVSALLLAIPLNESLRERTRESVLANRLAVYAGHLEAALHPVFGEAIAETLNLLTIHPESKERVTLPYKVATPRPRPDLEASMLDLVNRERVAAGLRPLAPDPELAQVGRRHSVDMFARSYFAHVTPEGRDPFNRMREAGVHFLTAGENLALAPTLQIAHTGLMNSPGHRANILNREFGRLGIGIMDGGIHGLMVTQEFRN
ncbi:MAG TPA: CvpA family protein [Pyrinomonadaceae bacterium]|nr:CvpA family protein [Pyrinomonadaceae bacterium]